MKYNIKEVNDILKEFDTSKTNGLSTSQANLNLKKYGLNTIEKKDDFRLLKIFLSKFNSIIIYVLAATALISYYYEHLIEFYVILIIIGFTVFLSFFQEYRAEKAVEALAKITAKKVEVIRDGKKHKILASHVVPGDIIRLKRGIIVPADIRIIEGTVSLNESILTGESVAKGKNNQVMKDHTLPVSEITNMAFSGSSVMNGNALGVIVATGFDSELGKISKTLGSIKNQKTPLQKKIDTMSLRVSYAVLALCFVVLTILLIQATPFEAALLMVAALAVSGIPESFPLALTLGLSSGVRRMAKSNAIVKDMASVETLGTTTVICTDKTGTLTENKMIVQKISFFHDDINVKGKPYEPLQQFYHGNIKIPADQLKNREKFFKACILCSDSETHKVEGEWKLYGEPTEGAILSLARSAGYDYEYVREQNKRIEEVPFDSEKKFMVTINEHKNIKTAYLKGAVEVVLKKADYIIKNGKKSKITPKDKREIQEKVIEFSSKSLRVLAIATKEIHSTKDLLSHAKNGYTFEGLVGIEDPIRQEVYGAVETCQKAGIRVIMVTGDHVTTAKAIGKRLGIVNEKYPKVIEGHLINEMSDQELDDAMKDVSIFARTTPEHKYKIVESLQRIGEVVAMTGDGVNDAPALKKADIGISMGKNGTDVARESSNLVLADDAFSTIVKAVREGRTIYNNIRRFTFYLLTINVAQASVIFLAILMGMLTPLTALMILFINIITSSLPSLGLSIETPNSRVMYNKPRDPKDRLLSKYILLKIFAVVPILIIGTMSLYIYDLYFGSQNIDTSRTIAFATIIVFSLFHAFNARSLHTTIFSDRLFKNKLFYISLALSMLLLVTSIYTPFGNMILSTTLIPNQMWMIIIGIGSLGLIIPEFIKLLIKAEFVEQNRLQGKDLKL
ncbi:MAG: cation-translocating P-type ATPase [Candidatus Woesearchaeota archaeon]